MPSSSGSSWETTSYRSDPLRKGLVERAKQRKVRAKRDRNWWVVHGNPSLGDSYDNYDVHLREDGSWYCSCSASTGGQYRKDVCSHRTAVILWRRDNDDPWEDEGEVEVEGDKGQLEVEAKRYGYETGNRYGYTKVHKEVVEEFGDPWEYLCAHCGKGANQWAYDHQDDAELVDERGRPYSLDIEHYIPLCLSCHTRFDRGLSGVGGAEETSVRGSAEERSAPSTTDSANDFKGSGGEGTGGPPPMRDVAGSRMTSPPDTESGEGGKGEPGLVDAPSSPDTSKGETDGGVKESADSNPVSPLDQEHKRSEMASPTSDESDDGGEESRQTTPGDTAVPGTPASDPGFDPYELDWDEPPLPQTISAVMEKPPLPSQFKSFRSTVTPDGKLEPVQWHGIIETVEALDDGVKCVFLSAPTGTGKSLVAATVPQILDKHFVYTATTHTLQEQIEREFGYAKVLKGRRNYSTLDDPTITADDCTKEKTTLPACPSCPGWGKGSTWGTTSYDDERGENVGPHCFFCHPVSKCPYEVAKNEANYAHMAVLNTTYFLSETNYVYRSMFRDKDLVFIDEADMLEEELMSFITVEVTAKTRKDLGIGLPEKKTVEESWVVWIRDEVIPAIKAKLANLPKGANNLFGKPDTKTLRARTKYKRLLGQVSMLLEPPPPPPGEEADEDDDEPALLSGWVMTGYETRKGEDKQEHNMDVIFKPITVRNYARRYLWSQGKQFVLMSATIISPEQMAYDLGLEDDEWVTVEIPSSFPRERRPVVARSEIEVTKKTMDSGEAYPVLVSQLHDIMEEHPDERILVHSNSYKLTRELFFETRKKSSQARSRLYAYFYANEREKALNGYLNDPRGVLVAPSFERGVDLHGDDCRVVVIAKVPFPYLGDKQISARLYGTGRAGKSWYAVQTIRTICQMTGRAMRSRDDWAISYILDKSFMRIYWENQNLFPAWWREAIVFDENDPKWKEPLAQLRNGEL